MMKFLDIHFNFLCRTTFKNSKGQYPIILRVIYRSQRRDIFTGLYCYKQEWNSKEAKLFLTDKKAGETNRNLDLIMRKANDVFDELRFSGIPFSIDELANKIKGKEQKPQYLIEYMQEVNKKMLKRVGIEITKATYYKYNKSVEYVQEFLTSNYKAKSYLVLRIDTAFIESYFLFLRTKKNNSHNTSLKYLSFLKVLLSPAIHSGIIKNDPFRDLKFKAKPVYREFLTQEEITLLENLEIDNETFAVRKIFSCSVVILD